MGIADDAVSGPVRMAEAIAEREYVKTKRDRFAAALVEDWRTRAVDYADLIAPYIKYQTDTIGSEDNPYILHMPAWMAAHIEQTEGMTAQEYATQWCRYAVRVVVVE